MAGTSSNRQLLLVILTVVALMFSLTAAASASVTVSGTGKADLIKAFEELDQQGNNGNWFRTSTNENGALAWNQAYVMYAYLRMFEATGDKTYLNRFIVHADSVLNNRDSVRGVKDYRGLSLPAWRASGRYTLDGKPYIFAAHTGMIASPLAEFANIVKDYNLPEYQSKAAVYLKAAMDAVAVHDDEWVDEGDKGYYIFRKGAPFWSDGVGLPFNMYLILGEVQISLYQATGEVIYLERAQKMARHFKSHLSVNQATNSYVWNYWWGIAYTGWTAQNNPTTNTPTYRGYRAVEDINHGILDIRFAEKAYRAGIVFNETDMIRFGNTLNRNIIKTSTSVANNVDGRGSTESMRITTWAMLYPWAPKVIDVCRDARYNAAKGLAGLALYARALAEINQWDRPLPVPPGNGGTTPPVNNNPEPPVNNNPAPPSGNPPAPAELIQNGDFNSNRTGWLGNRGVIGTDTNGNKYISNDYNWGLFQNLSLQPGQRYVINAQTSRGNATTTARILVTGIDSGGKLIKANQLDIRHNHKGSGWESFAATEFTVPAGAVTTRIYLLTNGGTGSHHFDNISVRAKQAGSAPPVNGQPAAPPNSPPAPAELIQNGDFNSNRTGWLGNRGVIGTDTNGNKYISNDYNWGLFQNLSLQPGQRYVINAQTRKGNATTTARILVTGIDSGGKLIKANQLDMRHNHKGSGWESFAATELTVPAGAVTTRIYLLTNGGTGIHQFDNISVRAL